MRDVIRIGVLLTALAAGITVSAQSPAPAEPISKEDADHFFKIDNPTGGLTPLVPGEYSIHPQNGVLGLAMGGEAFKIVE